MLPPLPQSAPPEVVYPDKTNWAAVIAIAISCGLPFVENGAAWTPLEQALYVIATLSYGILQAAPASWHPLLARLRQRLPAFLVLSAVLALTLQRISGDGFVQPIVFDIPMLHAATMLSGRRLVRLSTGFIGIMAFGLWLAAPAGYPAGILIGVIIRHAALMSFIVASGYLTAQEMRARIHAHHLATVLAAERDYLQHLMQMTSTLSHEIDLVKVLSLVAWTGRTIAHAASVRIWMQEDAGWVLAAHDGEPPALLGDAAAPDAQRLDIPLVLAEERIGRLELVGDPRRPFAADTELRLRPFAQAAAIAIHNAHLYDQAQQAATLAERNRLARELHDTIAQGLAGVHLQLQAATQSWTQHPQRAYDRVARAREVAQQTLHDVRHSVWDLAAPLTTDAALLEHLAHDTAEWTARTGLRLTYEAPPVPVRLPSATALHVRRMVGEALANIEKHAGAQMVAIAARIADQHLEIMITDDGRGFVGARVQHRNGAGFGLRSLNERARLIAGSVDVRSQPGQGAQIQIRVPLLRDDAVAPALARK